MKKIIILLAILLLLPFSLKLKGQGFGRDQSLFSDIKARRVGDILTVIIVEQNRASSQVESKTEKSGNSQLSGGPGVGPLLRHIPIFSADAKMKNDFEGKGENLRTGTIMGKISVTVVEVRENGDLVVEGSRVIGISGDKETLNLTGVVRQKDIAADNSVQSYQIADAEVVYTGKGNTNTGARPGFIARLVNWIF
ncbi:MAG TPA: flagellar basal body L-ring protein FlgH [Acidobacteriota bacterium]|nr:flagellar basal body L-ring protein FlgH [Acidobacteriota bacterium]